MMNKPVPIGPPRENGDRPRFFISPFSLTKCFFKAASENRQHIFFHSDKSISGKRIWKKEGQ